MLDEHPDDQRSLVNSRDQYERTPLHYSAFLGDLEITFMLLEAGAGVYNVDFKHRTACHYAAIKDYTSVFKTLLKYGDSNSNNDGSEGTFDRAGSL